MQTSELFELLKEKIEKFRPALPEGFAAVALVNLTGPDPARWRLSAAEGRLDLAAETSADPVDLTVTLAAETAAGLCLKTINPLAAFLTGKVKIQGDPAKIACLKQLLTSRSAS